VSDSPTASLPDVAAGWGPAAEVPPRPRTTALLRQGLTAVVILVTLGAVARQLRGQDWSVLATTVQSRPASDLLSTATLAGLANAAALMAAMVAWWLILSGNRRDVRLGDAARLFCVGQFTKYVPGKVFGLMVSIRMGRDLGITPAQMTSAWLLTLVVGLSTGAAVALIGGSEVLAGSAAWLAVAALPIVVLLVRPQLVGRAGTTLARLRRRPAPPG